MNLDGNGMTNDLMTSDGNNVSLKFQQFVSINLNEIFKCYITTILKCRRKVIGKQSIFGGGQ